MAFLLSAAALLLHTCWWGAGPALALTPRRWRRFWPVFAPVCGFSLQTAVVWLGVLLDWPGTRGYAAASELIPAGWLAWQLRRAGRAPVVDALRRTAGLWALVAVVLALLVLPLAWAAPRLTTVSLGSCDAADYAAGARLMQEFRRSDRAGFLGQTEVVSLHSVDNFFDHFVRLNHFAPSALVAHHGAILGRRPYELIGVLTAVFLAASLPLVFWLARATLRLRPAAAWAATGVYAFSPVTWYAVFHVAMSQLLAAQAIAVVTIAGVVLWRRRATWPAAREWFGLLAVAFGLIWAAYNFIIVVALVPAATFVLGGVFRERRPVAALLRWSAALVVPALAAGAFFAPRVAGLVERFLLFRQYDFGWPIRGLSPEGWLGAVVAPHFTPLPAALRWPLVVLVVAAIAAAWTARAARGRRWLAFSLTAPVLAGYAFLLWRGAQRGTNASYDAYKLLSVFYPGILAVALAWVGRAGPARWRPAMAALLALILGAANVAGVIRFSRIAATAPLVVDPPLAGLRELEERPEVTSINLRLPDMWSRLWANAFLLRREQYFPEHTYEGRRNTELRGAWDLTPLDPILRVVDEGSLVWSPEPAHQLRRSGAPPAMRLDWGEHWFGTEWRRDRLQAWRWSGAAPTLTVDQPGPETRWFRLRLHARSLGPRELDVWVGDTRVGRVRVSGEPATVEVPALALPAGRSTLRLTSPAPAQSPGPGDARALLVAVYRLELVRAPAPSPLPTAPAEGQNPAS